MAFVTVAFFVVNAERIQSLPDGPGSCARPWLYLLTRRRHLSRPRLHLRRGALIMEELNLSVLQMSVVFSAFTLSYSLFEIPSGWLGDVKGPRRVLTRIVLWWSAFTMLTGVARGFPVAGRDPVPLRRRRSGRVSEHRAQLLALVSRRASAGVRTASCSSARGSAACCRRRWRWSSSRAGAGARAS